eukprot:GHVT01030346.1.p1 GENE.GHVT01030346.1~~GHVT01030346.1.p1  ORF type:complete len:123 (-),score=31.68 GHVT01030346.1:433-801(-)
MTGHHQPPQFEAEHTDAPAIDADELFRQRQLVEQLLGMLNRHHGEVESVRELRRTSRVLKEVAETASSGSDEFLDVALKRLETLRVSDCPELAPEEDELIQMVRQQAAQLRSLRLTLRNQIA